MGGGKNAEMGGEVQTVPESFKRCGETAGHCEQQRAGGLGEVRAEAAGQGDQGRRCLDRQTRSYILSGGETPSSLSPTSSPHLALSHTHTHRTINLKIQHTLFILPFYAYICRLYICVDYIYITHIYVNSLLVHFFQI